MNEIGSGSPIAQVSPSPPAALPGPARNRRPGHGRRLLAAGAVLLLMTAGAVGWWSTRGTPTVRYATASVTRGSVVLAVTSTGTINPELTVIVGSYVSGVIQQLYCDYNTAVKAGQICARIDPRPYQTVVSQSQANLEMAKAQLKKDEANLAYAKLSYQRNLSLAQRQYGSQDAADAAKNLYDQAQAQVGLDQATIDQRQAELDAAEVNLGYTNIVSPVDGTVVSRNVTQGQTVASSFQTPTLFLIASDLTKMQVDTNVSESDIGGIKEGNKATFTVDAFPNRIFEGKVTQVRQSPQTVQNVVTFDAVIGVDNRDLALKPGMTASTRIVVAERSGVIRVPSQALRYAPGILQSAAISGLPEGSAGGSSYPAGAGATQVWVLRDGQAVPVAVKLGLDDGTFAEIADGDLSPGEQVITGDTRGPNGPAASSPPAP